ncbi:hypothetical protein [Hydrogenophaga luteola]|uniref:Uncharacterized protein n=1 Tax=Hydrogenophaga luteola TaxID=1591122 RepID=A0ABV7W8W8_9BURK
MLIKTEKGRLELRPGHRSLGQRERAMLLVADGQQSESKMAELFQGDGRRLIDQLLAQGYLVREASGVGPSPSPESPPQPRTPASHGEQFAGTRSLATARMFLFDLSERLFAPRDKALANRYRDALREARDPEAMLAVGRALIADVEALAGSERADGISERLAKLLPAGLLENSA